MTQILKTMTIQEAAALWDDPLRVHLGKWERDFNQPLENLHSGHIATYEKERLAEVGYPIVWTEVKALRTLLKHAGVGQEIESHYRSPLEKVKLTPEEMQELPARARAYIEYLEKEISGLESEKHVMQNKIRKHNWGRSR
jgi:hypothetical protein